MDDNLKAILLNFVDMVIEYPEYSTEESFRRSGLDKYLAAQHSVQADGRPVKCPRCGYMTTERRCRCGEPIARR